MTATSTAGASAVTSRYENRPFNCGGAQIRAHCRHLAMVVTITGDVDAVNVDRVGQYLTRLLLVEKPIVLDLSDVDSFAAQAISLLYRLDEACDEAGLEWALVANRAVMGLLGIGIDEAMFPIANSVPQALRHFADAIHTRRRLLPLLTTTS